MFPVQKHLIVVVDGYRFYRQTSGYYRSYKLHSSLHRYVWEKANGRPVPPEYSVHHIDGNRDNNDPANLALLDKWAHGKLHGRPKGTGKERARCSAPECDRMVVARGLCNKHWGIVRRLEKGQPPRKWRTADRAADRHFQEVIAPALAGEFAPENPASIARWPVPRTVEPMRPGRWA